MTAAARTRGERFAVIYQCPECDERFIDERRCPDCNLFTRRVDHGGACPHCEEPVAIEDLADPTRCPEVRPKA